MRKSRLSRLTKEVAWAAGSDAGPAFVGSLARFGRRRVGAESESFLVRVWGSSWFRVLGFRVLGVRFFELWVWLREGSAWGVPGLQQLSLSSHADLCPKLS